jgi:hypothetical protein
MGLSLYANANTSRKYPLTSKGDEMSFLWQYTEDNYICLVDIVHINISPNGTGSTYLLEVIKILEPGWFGGIRVGKRFVVSKHPMNKAAWSLRGITIEPREDNGKKINRNSKGSNQKRLTTVVP